MLPIYSMQKTIEAFKALEYLYSLLKKRDDNSIPISMGIMHVYIAQCNEIDIPINMSQAI